MGKDTNKSAHEELYKRWKKIWISERNSYMKSEDDVFLMLFQNTYEIVEIKKEKNKTKNFLFKSFFVGSVLAIVIFYAFIMLQERQGYIKGESILENGYLAILFILAVASLNKWINIKKYQETWARHSTHMHRLEIEMYKYVEGLEPYQEYPSRENDDKNREFIKNILKIWGDNQVEFVSNLENKETDLMDIFKYSNLGKKS